MTVLEEQPSADGTWRARICRRPDARLQVFLERWSDDPHELCWIPVTTSASVTDSLDIARRLARGLLDEHAAR